MRSGPVLHMQVEAARQYFALPRDSAVRVHVGDGVAFMAGVAPQARHGPRGIESRHERDPARRRPPPVAVRRPHCKSGIGVCVTVYGSNFAYKDCQSVRVSYPVLAFGWLLCLSYAHSSLVWHGHEELSMRL